MARSNGRSKFINRVETDSPQLITVNPGSGLTNKIADDFSGGIQPLSEYISIPIDLIEPFSGKRDADFSRSPAVHAQMVSSIREHGVLEPLTVRKIASRQYEILAGETRWLAAREAGLKKLPCRLIEADDAKARVIFTTTNLVRRDLNIRDRINGWWLLYNALKDSGRLQAFRTNTDDPEFSEIMSNEGAGSITFRQIQRYVKCHDLINEWIDRLESDEVTFVTAYRIAFFPAEVQTLLLQYSVEEKKLADLYKVYENKVPGITWDGERTIEAILGGKLQVMQVTVKQKAPETQKRTLSRSTKIMLYKTVVNEIRDEDFDNVESVVREALKMYYEIRDKVNKSKEN